jgi:hypothetical protein
MTQPRQRFLWAACLTQAMLFCGVLPAGGPMPLGPEEFVQANALDIVVSGYSVPSLADLNGDGLKDLIVGEGSGSSPAMVRIYPNAGTNVDPKFADYSYAQSNGSDLVLPGSGCLGLFPRSVDWDMDGRQDLLIGLADGTVKLYSNTGTTQEPTFDGGSFLQVGSSDAKRNIDVGVRSTPTVVDWNGDQRRDLAIGAMDGRIHLFINEGTNDSPEFLTEAFAQEDNADLFVPTGRSSPVVLDMDGDGAQDLLTGNTAGELLLYSNVGTDGAPHFAGYVRLESNGVAIDLPGLPRSRPFVDDWTGDGLMDVLTGAGDGAVRLFQAVPEPSTLASFAVAAVIATLGRRRLVTRCDRAS